MFDNLKKAFSNASTGFSEKDLNEKDIEDVLFELEINLLESDVATEVIDSINKVLLDTYGNPSSNHSFGIVVVYLHMGSLYLTQLRIYV